MAGQDNFDMENGDEGSRNYHSPNMSSGWRFSRANLRNTSMGSNPPENPMSLYRGDLMESSSCSPASLLESFCPNVSDQPMITSQSLSFCDVNVKNNSTPFNGTAVERITNTSWTTQSSLFRRNVPLLSSSGMFSQSLSQLPVDLGFIERAARFSSFSGGNFGDITNSFSIPGSMSLRTSEVAPIQGPADVFSCVRLNSVSGEQSQEIESNMVEGSRDVSMSHNKRHQDQCESGNGSVEAEFSGGAGGQAEPLQLEGTGRGTFAKGRDSNKRKKIGQDSEPDQLKGAAIPVEATKHNSEIQKKGDHKPASIATTTSGKDGKPGSDSVKQEYIHVRARRGQATNSHSLAERVRREKISERMKFLQDLVPGCSKVTGKAVMLVEIINYVQSLQQQVEFLSMKLASVNPRLDFNIEGILPEAILQSQAGPSSGLGFHSDMSMSYPPLHLSKPGKFQGGVHDIGTSSDAFRKSIASHMPATSARNKDSTSQVPDVWEDELHNIVQTGLNPNAPMNDKDIDGRSGSRQFNR